MTKNTVIAQEATAADTFFSRVRGLLGRKGLSSGEGLLITKCNSIHTFFMRFAIDVIFIGSDNRVKKCRSALKPFRMASDFFQSTSVVELPCGAINSTSTQPGDLLSIT